jgi:hypothetical protein
VTDPAPIQSPKVNVQLKAEVVQSPIAARAEPAESMEPAPPSRAAAISARGRALFTVDLAMEVGDGLGVLEGFELSVGMIFNRKAA